MPQFILKINLGNDAMQTGYDVAHAIRDVAYNMQDLGDISALSLINKTSIRDTNGNKVGYYEVIES